MDVNVVENTDNTVHITMPMKPSDELSDDQLANAAGGQSVGGGGGSSGFSGWTG